ncbi:MAG: hypothetical protein HKUEN02_21970 [Anaerolineaceae bacterium]|nr:MAG: hypothetical protein HKUEN02_21970 [Anaerolineaceae bacterium]
MRQSFYLSSRHKEGHFIEAALELIIWGININIIVDIIFFTVTISIFIHLCYHRQLVRMF